MKYYCIPTNIGMAAASNAFLTGTKVNITTFVVGDGAGSEYEPAPDMTALRGQVWQGAVTNAEIDSVSPNIINYTALLPSNVGGFTMREMGLKDDTGRLISVGNMASTPKIKFEDGISDETELIFSLTISTPEAMEWKVDPTVIIATKKDIDKHNTNTSAHEDLRAELGKKANITEVCRPNLLINGDFSINQRGQNSYAPTSGGYTVDMWKYASSAPNMGKVTIENGYIVLHRTKVGTCIVEQKFENPLLVGENYTAAIELSSGEVFTATITLKSTNITVDISLKDCLRGYFEKNYFSVVNYSNTVASKDLQIKKVKLELGNRFTGFYPSDPATELARCQRYYQSNFTGRANGIAISTNFALLYFPLWVPTRTSPAVSIDANLSECLHDFKRATTITPTLITEYTRTPFGVVLKAEGTFIENNPLYLVRDVIHIDANL